MLCARNYPARDGAPWAMSSERTKDHCARGRLFVFSTLVSGGKWQEKQLRRHSGEKTGAFSGSVYVCVNELRDLLWKLLCILESFFLLGILTQAAVAPADKLWGCWSVTFPYSLSIVTHTHTRVHTDMNLHTNTHKHTIHNKSVSLFINVKSFC